MYAPIYLPQSKASTPTVATAERAIIEAEASKFGDIKLFAEDALGIFALKDPVFEV